MRGFGNLCSLCLCPVITPEIILVERLKIFADRDHAGAGGIHGQRFHLIAANVCLLRRHARCLGQGAHLIGVRLCRVLGIVALAMQRVLC